METNLQVKIEIRKYARSQKNTFPVPGGPYRSKPRGHWKQTQEPISTKLKLVPKVTIEYGMKDWVRCCYFKTEFLSFPRVIERESDKLSESLESFCVSGNCLLCSPPVLAVDVVAAADALAIHLSANCSDERLLRFYWELRGIHSSELGPYSLFVRQSKFGGHNFLITLL